MPFQIRKVRLIRELSDVSVRIPTGTPGLHFGARFHFDLGYAQEHGEVPPGILPIYDGLVEGEDYEDLGEWDGTRGYFVGWNLNPIRMRRS